MIFKTNRSIPSVVFQNLTLTGVLMGGPSWTERYQVR